MRGVMVPVGSLHPWDKNPRLNSGAVDAVAGSIKRFGFMAPIIALPDGMIVAGHTRYSAALKLGLSVVPVVYVTMSLEDAKTYAVADNRVAELGSWDERLLAELASSVPPELAAVAGFSESEISDMVAYLEEAPSLSPAPAPGASAAAVKAVTVKYGLDEFAAVNALFEKARARFGVYDNSAALLAAARRCR